MPHDKTVDVMEESKSRRKTKNREASIALGETIANMYKKGVSAGRIAKQVGVTRQTVYYHLERFGIKRRAIGEYFSGEK